MKLNAEEIREQNRRAIAECHRIIEEATIVLEDATHMIERFHRGMRVPVPGRPSRRSGRHRLTDELHRNR